MAYNRYRTLCSVSRDRKKYPAGSEIPLPEETATRLLAMDPPAIERIADAAGSASVREPAQRLNAKDTIKLVRAARTMDEVLRMQAAEEALGIDARRTVLDEMHSRLLEIQFAPTGDEDEAEAEANAVDHGEGAEDA